MFYGNAEHLLGRSGALAHVWLAANFEKKLNKNQILQDRIADDIDCILDPDISGGPLALRVSGHLLYGIVRIYSRKTRYLQDDCQEALLKIRNVFKAGDIDLPSTQSHTANPTSLTLPDVITEIDLLAPMPDISLFLAGGSLDLNKLGALEEAPIADWDNSQFLSGSIEQPRADPMLPLDDDLDLDMGDDMDVNPIGFDDSIEIGRNAPLERRLSEELASSPKIPLDDDLGVDMGDDFDTTVPNVPDVPLDLDLDIDMGDVDMPAHSVVPVSEGATALEQRGRTNSPLSSIRSSIERDLEQTQRDQTTTIYEPENEQEESVHQAQRVKRRKVIHADVDTEIHSATIREQQNDRSKILKPASFLPRDPMLLALMNMQRTGGFVSSILGDGRSRGWAPELRGILSLEVVSRPAQKRKRDSGVADLETEEEDAAAGADKTPQLEFEEAEPEVGHPLGDLGDDTSLRQSVVRFDVPDDEVPQPLELEDDEFSAIPDNFDDTTAPLTHPADSGPISLATQHAVHLLREKFGADAEHSESQRQRSSVLFQEMFPERQTTKADATKMFFEVLVLATKDAIKVEQPVDELGGPLRLRAKRGLWGAWAEQSASGELANQSRPATPAAVVVEV